MIAVALALATSLCWGVGDFLGGYGSRRMATVTVLAISQPAGLAFVVVAVAALGEPWPSAGTLAWAAVAGAAGAIGLGALYRGMAVGAVAIVAPISAAAAVIPLAVGLARGERPSALQLAGIALVLGGVVLASRDPAAARGRLAAGVGLALVAACGFGAYYVLIAEASAGGALWAVVAARGTASILVLAVAAGRSALRCPPGALPLLVAIGLFDTVANVALAFAFTQGLTSVVSVLASLYPVVTVLLARAIFGERVARSQGVGAAGALAGVALVSAG